MTQQGKVSSAKTSNIIYLHMPFFYHYELVQK